MMYQRLVLTIVSFSVMACSPYHPMMDKAQRTMLESRDQLLKADRSKIFEAIEKSNARGALWYADDKEKYHLIPADSPLDAAIKVVESSAPPSHRHSCAYISAATMAIEPIMYNCLALVSEAKAKVEVGKRLEAIEQDFRAIEKTFKVIERDITTISTGLGPTMALATIHETQIDLMRKQLKTLHEAYTSAVNPLTLYYEQLLEVGNLSIENYEEINERLGEIQRKLQGIK